MTTAQTFLIKAIENAQTAMLAYGCPTKRLIANLQSYGGAETVKDLARKHRVSDGFDALVKCGHPELTLEALAVQGKYGALFTDEEVNWCLEVLVEAGYF